MKGRSAARPQEPVRRGYWAERRRAGCVYLLVLTGAAWVLWFAPTPILGKLGLFPALVLGPLLLMALAGPWWHGVRVRCERLVTDHSGGIVTVATAVPAAGLVAFSVLAAFGLAVTVQRLLGSGVGWDVLVEPAAYAVLSVPLGAYVWLAVFAVAAMPSGRWRSMLAVSVVAGVAALAVGFVMLSGGLLQLAVLALLP